MPFNTNQWSRTKNHRHNHSAEDYLIEEKFQAKRSKRFNFPFLLMMSKFSFIETLIITTHHPFECKEEDEAEIRN